MNRSEWIKQFHEYLRGVIPQEQKRPTLKGVDIIDHFDDKRVKQDIYITRQGEKVLVEAAVRPISELFPNESLVCVYEYFLKEWNGSTTDIIASIQEIDDIQWLFFRYFFDVSDDMEITASKYATARFAFASLLGKHLPNMIREIQSKCQ